MTFDARNLLRGARIADFTFQAAGPYASSLLAMLGADVIKIESKSRPDPTRGRENRPYSHSVLFPDVNLGKRCISLNMKNERAVEIARGIISKSDAVMENMRPGVMDRWGLSYEELRRENPRLIFASMSATGKKSPLAGLPGYAPIFSAMGGLSDAMGFEDGPPTELSTSVDMRVGATFAASTMLALLMARVSGRGTRLDLSAIDVSAMLIGDRLAEFALEGHAPRRLGNARPDMAPHGTYKCQGEDDWLFIAARDDGEWCALAGVIGAAQLAIDPRFATVAARIEHRQEVDKLVAAWTASRDLYPAFHALQKAGVVAAPVLNGPTLYKDEHLQARNLFFDFPLISEEVESGLNVAVVGPPWMVNGERPCPSEAPKPGRDTTQILRELLELSDEEIESLAACGALD